jgi:hypothetical protein
MPFKHFATLVIWDYALPDGWKLDDEHSNWPPNPVIDGLPYRLESKRYNDAVYVLDIEAFKSKNTALAEEKKVLIDTIEDGRRIINNRYEDAKEAHQYRLRLEAENAQLVAGIQAEVSRLNHGIEANSAYNEAWYMGRVDSMRHTLKSLEKLLHGEVQTAPESERTVEKKELLLLGILRDAYLATIPNGTNYAKVMMETRAILRTGLANHIGIHESEFYGGSEHAEALLAKALNTFEKELQDITPIEPKEHNPFALATQADKDEVIDIIFPPVESDLLISGTITNLKKNLVRQMETVASFTLMGAQVVYVTAFPRTYEKYKEALKEGSLIRAELKHDTSRYPTGHFILVSIITPGAKHG